MTNKAKREKAFFEYLIMPLYIAIAAIAISPVHAKMWICIILLCYELGALTTILIIYGYSDDKRVN